MIFDPPPPTGVKDISVVVTLSSHRLESKAAPSLVCENLIASWISGTRMDGPSVKSRIVLILPKIGTVRTADELKVIFVLIPTTGLPVKELEFAGI